MNLTEMAIELLSHGYEDWEVEDETTLICPCGDPIEWDGECESGHQSPLIRMGLI